MTHDSRLTTHPLDVAVGAFVSELARCGIRHVCICPGSRSTPLAIKLAQQPGIKVWTHLDERSAAYFGLGLAKALGEPVVLLATSGTAAANFLPAIVEAFLSRVPLVVLTADRPHELRDVGAPQTIDQLRLYGEHVKWFFDLPEPEATPEHVRLVRTLAARAVSLAMEAPAGPVHLNWPFREPLVPGPSEPAAPFERTAGRPYVEVHAGRLAPPPEVVERLAADLAANRRGVILCGPQDDPTLPPAVARLAHRLGYPILADPLSGVRCGPHVRSALVVDAYDALLRHANDVDRLAPSVVMRFGAMPTSKSVLLYLQRSADARQIVVDPGGWREPTGLATDLFHADPVLLSESLLAVLPQQREQGWSELWSTRNFRARDSIEHHLAASDELSEVRIFSELGRLLPDGAVIYAGNSMPVRDLDTFLPASERRLRCMSNRGANGIDGVVSSALGASAAVIGPVVLVIGDISLYHDMNGLLAARQHGLDLVVVLVNNDGGGIFSFLPQAQAEGSPDFELLFGTPHGLDFRPFVEGYGGFFARVSDWPSFEHAVSKGLARGGLSVVEVPTDRAHNVVQHRAVWEAVVQALAPVSAR